MLAGRHRERNATVSPSGRWIAYQSNETGRWEVYVRRFPDVESVREVVSRTGGWSPAWGPDEQELFFITLEGLARVALEADPDLAVRTESVLFPLDGYRRGSPATPRGYDISPSGDRFLFLGASDVFDSSAPPQITVTLNWDQELLERVPVN